MKELRIWAAELLSLEITDQQLTAFGHFANLLVDWNQKFNLTSITEKNEIIAKHFLDSLTCFSTLPQIGQYRLIDLGTGAGFPGIPLKIINPDICLTLVDSVRKKVDFCELAVKELSISNVEAIHTRAEDLGQNRNYREKFDWSVARAVADLSVLAEYLLPLTKVGGHVLVMKGAGIREEIQRAEFALSTLGGKISKIEPLSLPEGYGERNLITIDKVTPSPGVYPRKAGTPAKAPLS
jgi:16S rRNA (guanine527-N7)-methyltransferase